MTAAKKTEIPPHTKWGIRITVIIVLLLTATIIKNCMGSFMYGLSTGPEQQKTYYELGYSHGSRKAQGQEKPQEPETENLLLRKLYRKGFRDGWDSVQPDRKAAAPGTSPETGR